MKHRVCLRGLVLLGLSLPLAASAAIDTMWSRHWTGGSGSDDYCVSVALDRLGRIVVAGVADDIVTIAKYDTWGRQLWRKTHPNVNTDPDVIPIPLVLDTAGNAYVAFAEDAPDGTQMTTVKLDTSGQVVWDVSYHRPISAYEDVVTGIAYDSVWHTIYVCGASWKAGFDYDYTVIRYEPLDGSRVWDTLWDAGALDEDYATAICVGPDRDPVVTGYYVRTGDGYYHWATLRLNRINGATVSGWPVRTRWRTQDDEIPYAIAADPAGNVFVTGFRYLTNALGDRYGFAIAKYAPTGGDTLWTKYDTLGEAAYESMGRSIRVLADDTCYIGGEIEFDSYDWFVAAGFDATRRYVNWIAAVDPYGNDDDFRDLALDEQNRPVLAGSVTDNSGVYRWMLRRYRKDGQLLSGDIMYQRNDYDGEPYCLAYRDTGHIYLAGYTTDTLDNCYDQTLARLGHDTASVRIDSLVPSDTVDSGSVVVPRVYYHNTGYSLARPTFALTIGTSYADTVVDTLGSAPGDSLPVVEFAAWTVKEPGGLCAWKCTMALAKDTTPNDNLLSGQLFVAVHDVGPAAIIGLTDTVEEGPYVPQASFTNFGNTRETFSATFEVGPVSSVGTVANLEPGTTRPEVLPSMNLERGQHSVRVFTSLASDSNRTNDTLWRPSDVFVRYRDVTASRITRPAGFYLEGDTMTPQAWVRNLGNTEVTFRTYCRIEATDRLPGRPLPDSGQNGRSIRSNPRTLEPSGFDPPYLDSTQLTLAAGDSVLASFRQDTAGPEGSYGVVTFTNLTGDQQHSNDTARSAFGVGSHDVATTSIIAPVENVPAGFVTPVAEFANNGPTAETFMVFCRIAPGGYADSLPVTLDGSQDTNVSFRTTYLSPGDYAIRCSTHLAADAVRANDTLSRAFAVIQVEPYGWFPRTSLPAGSRRKNVRDGGLLTYAEVTEWSGGQVTGGNSPDHQTTRTPDHYIYALKGNNTYEFYRFDIAANVWETKETIPAYNPDGRKKKVKKGSVLVAGTDGRLYATKGNNTLWFWQYDPTTGIWSDRREVPLGGLSKKLKEGTDATVVRDADLDYVYLLKGSGTDEFYRYVIASGFWETMASAPMGRSGKPYKKGSCIAYDSDAHLVYALKGTYNEFSAYDIATNTWNTRESLPFYQPGGRKKKVKDGADLAYHEGIVYALKGGNTNEFWQYQTGDGHWYPLEDMPVGTKRVKGGGALAFGAERCWAFRGNNTLEFWQYLPRPWPGWRTPPALGSCPPAGQGAMLYGAEPLLVFALSAAPNPARGFAVVHYALPVSGHARLKLYGLSGRLVSTLVDAHHQAGAHNVVVSSERLAASGVYLLYLEANGQRLTQKLILE